MVSAVVSRLIVAGLVVAGLVVPPENSTMSEHMIKWHWDGKDACLFVCLLGFKGALTTVVILRPGKDALKIGLPLYFLFLKLSIDIKLAHMKSCFIMEIKVIRQTSVFQCLTSTGKLVDP